MNWTVVLLVAMICVAACYWLVYYYQRHMVNSVAKYLYQENNPKAAVELLEGAMASLLIPKRTRYLMLADVYIVAKDHPAVQNTFQSLKEMKGLNAMNKIGLYQKELSFYAMENSTAEAEDAYGRLIAILTEDRFAQNKQVQALKAEADQLIEIYIRHNTAYIEPLKELAENTENTVYQGIYFYRLAKLYYYKEDEQMCRAYLKKAKALVKGSELEDTINDMLEKDLSPIAVK